MTNKSLNIIASSAKMMADSARSMEALVENLETAVSTQNTILGAFVDKLEQLLKKAGGGGGGEKAGGGGKGSSMLSSLGGLGKISKDTGDNLKAMGEGLTVFSKGLLDFAKAGIKFMIVPQKVMTSMVDLIVKLAEQLAKIDGKKIQEGAEGLSSMAGAIAIFGLTLALAAPVYLIAALGALIVIPTIAAFAYVFSLIGKAAPAIDAGAKAVAWMGLAIASFGLALWITKTLVGGSWKDLAVASLIVVGALALFGITFYIISEFADPIQKSAKAVAWMGLAIIALGIGLAIFQAFNISFGTVLVAAGAVAILGIAFGIAGIFGSLIEAGVIPLAMAGLALIALALGIGAFRLFGIETADYLAAGGAVAVTAGAFMLAGLLSPLILLGAVALIVAGVALISLSAGLAVMNTMYVKAMDGILAPSTADPEQTNLDIVIGSVVDAFFINPVKAVFMMIGAVALMFASIALVTLAGGLFVMNALYKKAMDGVLAKSTNEDYQTNLDFVVGSVVEAFYINPVKSVFMMLGAVALIVASVSLVTLAGGIALFNLVWKKTKDSGLFKPSATDPDVSNFEYTLDAIIDGMVMGPFRLMELYAAVPAWIMAGIGLITIGTGLSKFVQIVEKNIDINKIGDMVTTVLTTVAECLINVGNGESVDWDDVEDGIEAVSDVGNVLSSIADGVAKMAELKIPIYDKNGNVTSYITIGDKTFDQVSVNMKKIINAVVGTLTEIGKGQGEVGWFSKSDGEKGADAIRGIGQDLVGLADFVQKAANLTFPIYDKDGKEIGKTTIDPKMLEKGGSVYRNIVAMIRSVTSALGEIGSGEAAQSGWFVDSDIEKGKQAIAGVSGDLNGIAQMVQSVATVQNFDVVEQNIKRTLILIPQAMLGAAEIIDKNRASLMKTGASISNMMDAIGSIIDALAKVAEKKITDKEGAIISNAVTQLIGAFSSIKPDTDYSHFQKAVEYIERLAGTADPMDRLAKSFDKIAKTMDKFGATFKKMDQMTLKNSTMLIQSLTTFAKADPNALNALSDKGKMLIQYIYEKNGEKKQTPPTPPTPAPTSNTNQSGTKNVTNTKTPANPGTAPIATGSTARMEQLLEDILTKLNKLNMLEDIDTKLSGTLKVTDK
jgi:hypothetical protein